MAIQKVNFKTILNFLNAHIKPLLIVSSFIVAMIFLFFAHQLWVAKRERAAQYDFASLMTEYDIMLRENNPEWSQLLEKFEKNYEKHSNSSLLPYYLGYKAQILLAQNKREEALAVLDTMIANMDGCPMLGLHEMERALVQLDSDNIQLNELGLKTLERLAFDEQNIFRDSAQYYLGRYYWSQNNIDQAKEVWRMLVDEQRDEKMATSPWVDQVQAQLTLMVV